MLILYRMEAQSCSMGCHELALLVGPRIVVRATVHSPIEARFVAKHWRRHIKLPRAARASICPAAEEAIRDCLDEYVAWHLHQAKSRTMSRRA